jgi:hypothetical protein
MLQDAAALGQAGFAVGRQREAMPSKLQSVGLSLAHSAPAWVADAGRKAVVDSRRQHLLSQCRQATMAILRMPVGL